MKKRKTRSLSANSKIPGHSLQFEAHNERFKLRRLISLKTQMVKKLRRKTQKLKKQLLIKQHLMLEYEKWF